MGGRRGSRRRRRRPGAPPTPEATAEPTAGGDATEATTASGGRYGKATLVLALLLGTFLERAAVTTLPAEAVDIFHLVIAVGVALLATRWYRNFMRRTLARSRERRRAARADRE